MVCSLYAIRLYVVGEDLLCLFSQCGSLFLTGAGSSADWLSDKDVAAGDLQDHTEDVGKLVVNI